MSVVPRELLELGDSLAAGDSAVEHRTAINRWYFANHNLAVVQTAKALRGYQARGDGSDHAGVIRALRSSKFKSIAMLLEPLREARGHADYHLDAANEGIPCRWCEGHVGGERESMEFTAADLDALRAVAHKCFSRIASM